MRSSDEQHSNPVKTRLSDSTQITEFLRVISTSAISNSSERVLYTESVVFLPLTVLERPKEWELMKPLCTSLAVIPNGGKAADSLEG